MFVKLFNGKSGTYYGSELQAHNACRHMYIIFTNLLMSVLMTPPPPPPADCHCPGPELVTILVIGSQNNNAFSHSKCTQLSFLYCLFKRRVLECAMFRITIIQFRLTPHSSSSLMSPRYAHLTSCITS